MNTGCDLVQEPAGYKPISEERGNGKIAIKKETVTLALHGSRRQGIYRVRFYKHRRRRLSRILRMVAILLVNDRENIYSHSIVAGGLLVMSYTTRLTPAISLTIRLAARASNSCGRRAQSAVMKSWLVTARRAITS